MVCRALQGTMFCTSVRGMPHTRHRPQIGLDRCAAGTATECTEIGFALHICRWIPSGGRLRPHHKRSACGPPSRAEGGYVLRKVSTGSTITFGTRKSLEPKSFYFSETALPTKRDALRTDRLPETSFACTVFRGSRPSAKAG